MRKNGKLQAGDRIVITCLPDGFIHHIETAEGIIRGKVAQPRSFDETIAAIRAEGCLPGGPGAG